MQAGNLPVRDAAMLARDYDDARGAFNEWLHFVTDTIEQQSDLEPEGAPSRFSLFGAGNRGSRCCRKAG
jgi:hypothetical protein